MPPSTCSAVVALMLALPMVILARAFMRVVRLNMSFMCAFLSWSPNCFSHAAAVGVFGSVMYGPMPWRREGREEGIGWVLRRRISRAYHSPIILAPMVLKKMMSPARSRRVCPGRPTITPVPIMYPICVISAQHGPLIRAV